MEIIPGILFKFLSFISRLEVNISKCALNEGIIRAEPKIKGYQIALVEV